MMMMTMIMTMFWLCSSIALIIHFFIKPTLNLKCSGSYRIYLVHFQYEADWQIKDTCTVTFQGLPWTKSNPDDSQMDKFVT